MISSARAALTALLTLSLAAPATAQSQLLERPASINGESITSEDIRAHARLVNRGMEGLTGEQLFHITRRKIAEEILLASEAERAGVDFSQRMVDDYWEYRNGAAPDYERLAQYAGTSVARQKVLARRSALANLYLLNKTGLRSNFGALVPPDPNLARVVKVTPAQLREAYRANKTYFDRPATVSVVLYACRDEDEVRAVMVARAAGTEPADVDRMPVTYPADRLEEVAEPKLLLPFLRSAKVGEIQRYDIEQAILIAALVGREPAREAVFSEAQEPLRNLLVMEMLDEAQQHLVRRLVQQATFWPRDLFRAPPRASEDVLAEPPEAVAKPPSGP